MAAHLPSGQQLCSASAMAAQATAASQLDQQQLGEAAVSPVFEYADETGKPVMVSVAEKADVVTFTFKDKVWDGLYIACQALAIVVMFPANHTLQALEKYTVVGW